MSPLSPKCPACGSTYVVRTTLKTRLGFSTGPGASCCDCGEQFRVSPEVRDSLPPAAPGDPFLNKQRAWDAALRYPMRTPHFLLVFVSLILGLALGAELVRRYGYAELVVVFMPITALGWFAGLWLFPRRRHFPGRCDRCGYDRRGLPATHACPECGTTNDRVGD